MRPCSGSKRLVGTMRPIDKGRSPVAYSDYREALDDLEQRLGRYCSHCERRLGTGLAVEHKAPKSVHPNRALDWGNFLLSCVNCNSVKGDKDVRAGETLWPDEHNTVLAIRYARGGFVEVGPALPAGVADRARALIDLVGLDRHKAKGFPSPARRDRRWQQREEAWAVAVSCLANYQRLSQTAQALELVVEAAQGHGFFSVWLSVFADFPAARRALVEGFPGTARACFDGLGRPVPRTALGV